MEKDTVVDPLSQVLKFAVGPKGWRHQTNFSVTKKTKKDHEPTSAKYSWIGPHESKIIDGENLIDNIKQILWRTFVRFGHMTNMPNL